jgi:hypothetical protein
MGEQISKWEFSHTLGTKQSYGEYQILTESGTKPTFGYHLKMKKMLPLSPKYLICISKKD